MKFSSLKFTGKTLNHFYSNRNMIDIGFDRRIIKISKTVYAKFKDKNGRWFLGTTKIINGVRKVYICDTLYKILANYKSIQNGNKRMFGKKI